MNTLASISKLLPAREEIKYEQNIPKIIWQTMKSNIVPPIMKTYADSWIDLNPEYEYRFHDDADMIKFLEEDFPEFLEPYTKIKHGAAKADLWRYLIIYKYGGVYADMDCRCLVPLRKWVNPKSTFTTQIGMNRDICQWLIMSTPGNPIFLLAAQKTLQNILLHTFEASYQGFELVNDELSLRQNQPLLKFNHQVLALSGPPVLQEAAEFCFKNGSMPKTFPSLQIVCVSGAVSCQMNGYVAHGGNIEYKKGLGTLKTPYYNRFTLRVIRKIFPSYTG